MRQLPVALLAALAALLLPATALADLGDPEATSYPLADVHGDSWIKDVARGPDGSIYLLDEFGLSVTKVKPDGTRDTAWGADGTATVADPNPLGYALQLNGVDVAADGMVYVGGTRSVKGLPWGTYDLEMAAAKIDTSGAQDLTFGDADHDGTADGVATYQGQLAYNMGFDVAAFDGGVAVGGAMKITTQSGSEYRMAAFAWNADGTPNPQFSTYGTAGLGLTDLVDSNGETMEVEHTEDGDRIVMAGYKVVDSQTHWTVARLDTDGVPDTSFDGDGHLLSPDAWPSGYGGTRPADVDVVNGDVYVGGNVDGQWGVAKFSGAGEPAAGFGDDGLARPSLVPAEGGGELRRIEVDPTTGEVYAVGTHHAKVTGAWAAVHVGIVRLGADGETDPVYRGGGGSLFEPAFSESNYNHAGDVYLLADGEALVVAGTYDYYPGDEDGGYALRPTIARLSATRTAPANTAAPQLSGNGLAAFGDTVTVSGATWSGYGTIDETYAWERCTTSHAQGAWAADDCSPISNATAASHVIKEADVAKHVRAKVTATNEAGLSTAWVSSTVEPSAADAVSDGAPVLAPNRDVNVGETLQVTDENFSGGPIDHYEYQWQRCPTADAGHWPDPDPCQYLPSMAASHVVTAADAGSWLRVVVTAIPVGNGAASAFSYSATRKVNGAGGGAPAGTAPARTADPVIAPDGTLTEGDTVRETAAATFSGTPAPTAARQWQRCSGTAAAPSGCGAISGATGHSYTTTSADVGRVVRLHVTAENGVGTATADSTGRLVQEKPAPPAPPAPQPTTPAPRPVDTKQTIKMPSVLGKTADEAVDAIAKAGIFADVKVDAQARKKPLVLKGKALDPGQVHSQSTAAGTPVTSSIGEKLKIKLVVEAGKPGFKACTAGSFTRELKGIDLEETWTLLKEKGCGDRVNFDFKIAGDGDDPEVRSASKDGRELRVAVTLPKSQAEYDLFPFHGQGGYPGDPMPSFGIDDLALTADADNVFGVRVFDRYIGNGTANTGARRVIGAKVYVDGDAVGADDVERPTREDTGSAAIFSKFRPSKGGKVVYLVQAQDAAGNKIFGFGTFLVKQRAGKFRSISGETWSASGKRVANAAGGPTARAAGVDQMWSWMQDLFRGGPLQALATVGKSAAEGLVTLAKKAAGPLVFAASGVANALTQPIQLNPAQVVASGGANVVAAGGANVVSAGGANVVAAGGMNLIGAAGGNVVSAGGANVVAAGGMNLLGREKLVSGTGSMRAVPEAKLISDNGLGLLSDNGLGLQGASKVIAPSAGAQVVAAGGGNLIGTAAGN